MMKAAVMQPYFFPYIGYWQLINSVDCFVIFDDVNFINRSWIYRNRILFAKNRYINLPLLGASQNRLINEVKVDQVNLQSERNSKILHEAYRKAPYYNQTKDPVDKCMYIKRDGMADYLGDQISEMCKILGITTKIVFSSDMDKPAGLKGEDKVIWLCRQLGADEYYNLIGGFDLYDPGHFESNGIKLGFIKADLTPYRQFGKEFVPALSIIDVLMFCGVEQTRRQLKDYAVIHKTAQIHN